MQVAIDTPVDLEIWKLMDTPAPRECSRLGRNEL